MSTPPPYRSLAVANWFVENMPEVDPLKLQKLIYYAHGWHLALKETPLIDETVEAWDYGPVIPGVYHHFKEYGNTYIPKPAVTIERRTDGKLWFITPRLPDEDTDTQAFMRKIAETYARYSGLELSADTHRPGTPWAQMREKFPGRKNVNIPDDMIQDYFKRLAADGENRSQ